MFDTLIDTPELQTQALQFRAREKKRKAAEVRQTAAAKKEAKTLTVKEMSPEARSLAAGVPKPTASVR